MVNGTTGQILWVNLTTAEWSIRPIADESYEKFTSGSGLAAKILYSAIPPKTDPLGPHNVLGFVPGLLTGSGAFFSGRWMAVGKSPLTGTWGESNCGGDLSPAIKRCGFDGIFFEGISPNPVYLLIDGQKIELRDASHLWGKDTIETQEIIKAEHGKRVSIACIGPAGEKLSLLATICNAGERMAARSGMGAVMGSKRLKGIALLGTQKITISDPNEVKRLNKSVSRIMKLKIPFPKGNITKYLGTLLRLLPFHFPQDGILYKMLLQHWGTISMNQVSVEMGDAPIRNWKGSSADFGFKQSDQINPDYITRSEKRKFACHACPLGCGGIVQSEGDDKPRHKPEYETVLSWSGLLGNNDLEFVKEINLKLNQAGMDSISAGATAAFTIECYENGLLTSADTGGLELKWGNTKAIKQLVEWMITREGIGDVLADGTLAASRKIGKGSSQYAMHAGGQELAMHDTRNDPGFALHAAVESTPGRHTYGAQLYYEMFKLWTKIENLPAPRILTSKENSLKNPEEKAIWAAACSQFMQLVNGSGVCLFGVFIGVNRIPIFEWLDAVTGWQKTPQEYMLVGKRIQTLKQMFNAREGIPLKHDINPRLLGIPKQARGANKGRSFDLDEMVHAYWSQFEWDENTGIPTPACLENLGLEELLK